MPPTETVLSGIRATGRLHFGNFMGAVQNFVKLQKTGNHCLYFIADLHTLTTMQNPEEMRRNIMDIAKDYLAAGLSPEHSSLYLQSSVPEITELTLYLSMVQPFGELTRIPTFKEKVRLAPNNVSLGLVSYPVLMAADILGPRATLVPVGEDQIPNVELARNLAQRFNKLYGQTFTVPVMLPQMLKVPGLKGGKMGKSEDDNAIDINASKQEIATRYREHGVTDVNRVRRDDPGDPYNGCKSVYPLHEMLTPGEKDNRNIANACRNASIGCAECKALLVDRIMDLLGPFQEKRRGYESQDRHVEEVLYEGGRHARRIISKTTAEVREKMGIFRRL